LTGFCSTSLNIDISLSYVGEDNKDYIMKILFPVGSKVMPLYRLNIFSQIGDDEILLDRKNISEIKGVISEYNKVEVYNVIYHQRKRSVESDDYSKYLNDHDGVIENISHKICGYE
jgi:hypothetical protein